MKRQYNLSLPQTSNLMVMASNENSQYKILGIQKNDNKCGQITQRSHEYIPYYKQLYGIKKPNQDKKIECNKEIEILKKKKTK